jgi:SAM-dependent methyltransferase
VVPITQLNRCYSMEAHHGHDFYDQQGVLGKYVRYRTWKRCPNEVIEKPIILSLLGSELTGSVLDLGCGYGAWANELLARGASTYTGIDSSRKMLGFGKALVKEERAEFIEADINQWEYPAAGYDLALACSVLHYIANLDELLAKIRESLKQDGALIISVDNPIVSSFRTSQNRFSRGFERSHYFNQGAKIQEWMGEKVIRYHRTLEEYWRAITEAGFRVECIKEGLLLEDENESEEEENPIRTNFSEPNPNPFEKYIVSTIIPPFLIIKAIKI